MGNVKSKYKECTQEKLTIVILFLLLGVSAKHFIEEVSTTVSQNVTTGSATCMPKGNKANQFGPP